MVKFTELPTEKGRIPLDHLSDFMEVNGNRIVLIAISQSMVAENKDAKKGGGLKAELWTGKNFTSTYNVANNQVETKPILYEDGLKVSQKWGKIPSNTLIENLKGMGASDTEVLGTKFFEYKLFGQRTGFPRLIPIKASDKKPEKL